MREIFVVLGALLMVGAVLPTAAAHWDWVNDGVDCNNANLDETDPIPPGSNAKNGQVNTCGIAGRVVGFAAPVVVGSAGDVVQVPGSATIYGAYACDLEVGDVTGGVGGSVSTNLNEVEIDETHQPDGEIPDNTWDDGGYGGACHQSGYAESDWNTEGCGETEDHGFARATAAVLPVFILAGCDLGTWSANMDPLAALVGAARCTVDQVRSGTPGTLPGCVTSLLNPPATGFANCEPNNVWSVNPGYATANTGPSVPTKSEVQTELGGSLDCSTTDGRAGVFVLETVDFSTTGISGPTTHVWTTGQR